MFCFSWALCPVAGVLCFILCFGKRPTNSGKKPKPTRTSTCGGRCPYYYARLRFIFPHRDKSAAQRLSPVPMFPIYVS